MKNTMYNGNEKIELIEVTQECLAEVTGGAIDCFGMPNNGAVTFALTVNGVSGSPATSITPRWA